MLQQLAWGALIFAATYLVFSRSALECRVQLIESDVLQNKRHIRANDDTLGDYRRASKFSWLYEPNQITTNRKDN